MILFSQSGRTVRRLLKHVVRHELRLLARGRTAPIVFLLLIVAVFYAAWNGTKWADEQCATIATIQQHDDRVYARIAAQLDDLARRGDPSPALQLAGMAWYIFQPEGAVAPAPHIDPRRPEAAASEWVGARHAVLTPAPFAALAVGQGDLHPYYTRVTIRTRPILVHSDEIENPINLLGGRFDLAFVLTFCCPILVLPLVYNILSEERDSGTLALVASQPLSLWVVLCIRIAVRGGAIVAAILFASLAALAIFGGLDRVGAYDVAVWCGAVAATVLFWCGLAAMLNVMPWRSATNATVLTVAWLALIVVLPALLGEVVSAWAPVPSRVQLIAAVRAATIRGPAQQDEVDRRIDPILASYRDATARQEWLADRVRYLSPPFLVYDAITTLAGTTTSRYRRFSEQVDAYHAEWRRYFNPLVQARTPLTTRHYDTAPRFGFQDEDGGVVRTRALRLVSMAGLIGVLLLAGALQRARRSGPLQNVRAKPTFTTRGARISAGAR